LKIFKNSVNYCRKLRNGIEPFLGLLNEAIYQYNMIIQKTNISKIDLKMTENKTSVEKINNIDKTNNVKTSNVDNTGEQPTYDKMVDEYEKWYNSFKKRKPNKSEIDKKQEELIDEYKKKGLKFSGHIDRKKIFIDRDFTGLK
jgi:hypothetical protein